MFPLHKFYQTHNMKNKFLLGLLLIILPFIGTFAQESDGNTYKTAERLFHISRSLNKNLVCYDVNLDGDKISSSVKWLMDTNLFPLIQKKQPVH